LIELMKNKPARTTSIHKVRRRALGDKRARGYELQLGGKRVRRADPECISAGAPDETLSGCGGLVAFGKFARRLGIDAQLRTLFGKVKAGSRVVYPMDAQLRLLLDANLVGEPRIFGVEKLGADPLFVRLAGGSVPSIDTLYRDLCRLDDFEIAQLEVLMASQGFDDLCGLGLKTVHVDIDTTVEPLFGTQEGALPGPNPRYHGRPSYHPILAVIAETRSCIGARLRPGDQAFGADLAGAVRTYVERTRAAVGRRARVVCRIDAAADCAEILGEINAAGANYIVKARFTPDLVGAVATHTAWRTVDRDADGRPTRQVAEIPFARQEWRRRGMRVRVVAVRSRERDVGKQIALWDDDYTVQAYLTNDFATDANDIAAEYNGRAEVEPCIAELKGALGIGKVPSHTFNANHVAFLIKLLAHNLTRRFVRALRPAALTWRMSWIARALFAVPARLLRSGRRWSLRLPPKSAALHVLRQLN
jgi:hypothetical protein